MSDPTTDRRQSHSITTCCQSNKRQRIERESRALLIGQLLMNLHWIFCSALKQLKTEDDKMLKMHTACTILAAVYSIYIMHRLHRTVSHNAMRMTWSLHFQCDKSTALYIYFLIHYEIRNVITHKPNYHLSKWLFCICNPLAELNMQPQ